MRRVLAISGKRFSGKDTLAGLLVDTARARGVTVHPFAFAADVRRAAAAGRRGGGPAPAQRRPARTRRRGGPTLTAFTVRALDEDPLVVCRQVLRRIDAVDGHVLISDLRLRVELEHLRPRTALHVLRLVRSDGARAATGWRFTERVDTHHTETELDEPALWDEVVANEGSIEELRARAVQIVGARLLPSSRG